ncbi:hypothetical protein HDU97_005304 [Phlyctochytrium planicorne]|nr:hypothetical protein HDU97_005304 [Phlyctochytrium planicorne]
MPSTTPCQSLSVRKEWRDMTDTEKRRFISAFNTVRKMPSTAGRRSIFDDLVAIHSVAITYIHQAPVFLPWHRAFLEILESLLQKVDSRVTIPFWDWGHDGQNPLADTKVFGSGDLSFGTRGDVTKDPPCIFDGFPKNWTSYFGVCLSRNYTDDFTLYDTSVMAPLITGSADFASFAGPLETAHNIVHYYTGGFGTDLFYIDLSPNDPLFFLLHANVDRYWYLWQQEHINATSQYSGTAQMPPFSGNNIQVSQSDLMPGFNLPVSTAMFTDSGGDYCSTYQAYSGSVSSPYRRRRRAVERRDVLQPGALAVGSGLHGTRRRALPGALPEDWIKQQHQRMFMAGSMAQPAVDRISVHMAMAQEKSTLLMADLPPASEPIRKVRENEAILQSIATKFDKELDDYLQAHPTASYSEAFTFVIEHWESH